jgi:DNA-binding Lrp family transcriptional regulator
MNRQQQMSTRPEALLSDLEFKLLNDFQRDFPLVAQPFAALASRLGVDEATVIGSLQRLQQAGLISRVGAVFRPNVVGSSTLAALAVPPERLEQVAALVSAHSEVNHNYQREHRFNLWFVATASCADQLSALFQGIEAACGCGPVLVLPLLEPFHIDLGFPLAANPSHGLHAHATQSPAVAAIELSAPEQAFLAALQTGLPLVSKPFAALGWPENLALELITRWTNSSIIKRFGVVVRHHELGFVANAMVVWNVPDEQVSQVGQRLAASNQVSLCYRRPRVLPQWPYNLFCMIHGKDRGSVLQSIAALTRSCGLDSYPHEVLFSCKRFKQRGARYASAPHTTQMLELASGSN